MKNADIIKNDIFDFYNSLSNDVLNNGTHNVTAYHTAVGLDVAIDKKISFCDYDKIREIIHKSVGVISYSTSDNEQYIYFKLVVFPQK